jgi:hypothetical protein
MPRINNQKDHKTTDYETTILLVPSSVKSVKSAVNSLNFLMWDG